MFATLKHIYNFLSLLFRLAWTSVNITTATHFHRKIVEISQSDQFFGRVITRCGGAAGRPQDKTTKNSEIKRKITNNILPSWEG